MIRLLSIFKKKIQNQLIAVIDYTDFFVFETYYQVESGLWKRTDLVTIESKEISSERKTELVLNHLGLSKSVKEKHCDFVKMSENYNRNLGLTSIRKQMSFSKFVEIYRIENNICITPTRNGGTSGKNKGYEPIDEKKIQLDLLDVEAHLLSKYLNEALLNCK